MTQLSIVLVVHEFGVQRNRMATPHFMDALGRETNTVVTAVGEPGSAATPGCGTLGFAASETTAYPDGTGDHVVHVDRRGVRTVTTRTSHADREESVTLTFSPANPDVCVVASTNIAYRNGRSIAIRSWDGGWTRETSWSDYAADGTRRAFSVTEASDSPVRDHESNRPRRLPRADGGDAEARRRRRLARHLERLRRRDLAPGSLGDFRTACHDLSLRRARRDGVDRPKRRRDRVGNPLREHRRGMVAGGRPQHVARGRHQRRRDDPPPVDGAVQRPAEPHGEHSPERLDDDSAEQLQPADLRIDDGSRHRCGDAIHHRLEVRAFNSPRDAARNRLQLFRSARARCILGNARP
jgi:hypothetical protein